MSAGARPVHTTKESSGVSEMTVREAGRRGGKATAEKYGADHFRALQERSAAKVAATDPDLYRRIGEKGGASTREHHGYEHYRAIGRAGGEKTKLLFGSEHYREAGRKGGRAARRSPERGSVLGLARARPEDEGYQEAGRGLDRPSGEDSAPSRAADAT